MFQKKYRLPATTRLQNASVIHTPFFTARIATNTLDVSRYGFIVGKKLDKRAVVRNRVKRRLRACIEDMQQQIAPGFDMLFLPKKEAIMQETSVLCQTIQEVFIKRALVKRENAV